LDEEREQVAPVLAEAEWLRSDLEAQVMGYAAEHLVPQHYSAVKQRKDELIEKARAAVQERLTKEIMFWDQRANDLKAQELAGRPMARINSGLARQRADELEARLRQRMEELEQERHLSPLPPVVIGGALVVPQALLDQLSGETPEPHIVSQAERERIDRLAVEAVVEAERKLGREPRVMPHSNPGYDIESKDPTSGRLYFIEVKGKAMRDDATVTISKTQILTALNKPDDWILAIVEVDGEAANEPRYVRQPFRREPDFGAVSVNYSLNDLLSGSEAPG
jgi:hypothetical protein